MDVAGGGRGRVRAREGGVMGQETSAGGWGLGCARDLCYFNVFARSNGQVPC